MGPGRSRRSPLDEKVDARTIGASQAQSWSRAKLGNALVTASVNALVSFKSLSVPDSMAWNCFW
jgi:hypothetical protein